MKYCLGLKIMKEFCFHTIYTLEIYTKQQFESNEQWHSNHSMAWGPLFKTNIYSNTKQRDVKKTSTVPHILHFSYGCTEKINY